jgi:hypothetical protein
MSSAAGQALDYSRANAYLKEIYAPKVEDMVPEIDRIAKSVPFVTGDKVLGRFYHQPVKLTKSMGVTFWNDGSAAALNKGLAPLVADALLQGSEILVRDTMSYDIMQAALSGGGGKAGAKAFVQATSDTMMNLTKSASFFREMGLLYGGGVGADASIATIETIVSFVTTTLVVTITAATWATAIWAGCENGEYDLYSGATKRNAAGTALARDNVYVLTSISPATRQLTFSSIAANVAAAVIGDTFSFAGSRTKDMVGIQAACALTGTLWNISKTSYYLWNPQVVPVGGQLSFEAILGGTAKVADVGFDGVLNINVSTQGFQDLANDQTALVRHADQKGGTVTMGYENIEYYSQTGKIRIKPHRLVKNGFAFGIPEDECVRVGTTDITYEMPGYGKMIRELEDTAGVEVRNYTNQAFFCKHPAYMVYYTGITNSR